MLERIKKALVESFVGAIVVGVLIANGIVNLVTSITTPLTEWVNLRFQEQQSSTFFPPQYLQFLLRHLIQQLIGAALFLLIAFLLLRWLYIEPSAVEPSDPSQVEEPEESA
jgi:mannose/fructose/N-acetylgalactosamine-specific phosphotransferase system component IID